MTVAICTALLLTFALTSWLAVRQKNATYDEVVHAPAGYTYLMYADFRVNPEHPPLFKYWAALPWVFWPPASARVDSPQFAAITQDFMHQWTWGTAVMYRTPGNDADALLARSRLMMLTLAVACGALMSWWAYRLAGPVAAIVTAAVFSIDPNFLAHAPLVTNDVAFSLVVVGLGLCLWRVGQHLTAGRGLALALLCGVAVTTKFTGVLAGPIVIAVLATRALLPWEWPVLGKVLNTRMSRLIAVAAVCVLAAVVSYGWIWAVYGFRAQTAPDPNVHANFDQMVAESAVNEIMARTGRPATKAEIQAWRPSFVVRGIMQVLHWHALPDAFVNGFWYVYAKGIFRYAYLLGEVKGTGWWYYFPVAMATKTPLATIAGVVIAGVVAIRRLPRASTQRLWAAVCIGGPAVILLVSAMRANMNIGVRHVLPVYAMGYVAAGVVAAWAWQRARPGKPAVARGTVIALLGLAAVETLATFPNFIPFFNVAAGGSRGGIRILGDSNLDWGQDLKLVADWQKRHPDRTLHLAYFGTADPDYYGIRYNSLAGQYGFDIPDRPLPTTGSIAVSATMLQGIWISPTRRNPFAELRDREPDEVLGGSIYVYDQPGK